MACKTARGKLAISTHKTVCWARGFRCCFSFRLPSPAILFLSLKYCERFSLWYIVQNMIFLCVLLLWWRNSINAEECMFIGDLYQSSHGLVVTHSHRQEATTLLLYVWVLFRTHQHHNVQEHLHLILFFSFSKHSRWLYRLIIPIISHTHRSATIHLLFRLRWDH